MPVDIVEWPQGQPPTLISFDRVGDQTEVAEEDIDVLAVGDRTRRCGRVGLFVTLHARSRSCFLPENLSVAAVDRESDELASGVDHFLAPGVRFLAALGSGQKDTVPADDGRGMTPWQRDLPEDVSLITEVGRQSGRIGDAAAVRTAKTGPVGPADGHGSHPEQGQNTKRI